ncbi:MAG TPA: hypothetical protein VMU95_02250 [Trebonia sp.]|nr:hypothetical protein [Trebonia sp.]
MDDGKGFPGFLSYLLGYLLSVFLWGSPATAIIAAILPEKHPPLTTTVALAVALAAIPPAIIMVTVWIKDRTGHNLIMQVGVPAGLATCAVIIGLAVAVPASAGKRCVDTRTMIVATPRDCQGGAPATRQFSWYYGGSGTEEDEPVRGGSFTAPGEEPAGRSGSGSGSGEGDDGEG